MPKRNPLRKARGSVVVQFALLLVVLITLLGVIQVGYLFYVKRDLQRVADLAALEAVDALQDSTTCSGAQRAGLQSIQKQWVFPRAVSPQPLQQDVVCLRWNTAVGEVPGSESVPPFNAVKVRLRGEGLRLLPFVGNTQVYAEAMAAKKSDPIAAFTVGSGVARLDQGALNLLLTLLLGTNVNLSLVDYEGIANANVNLLGLANALNLNVGTYDQLAGADLSLAQLLNATVDVITNDPGSPTAGVAVDALNRLLQLPLALDIDKLFIHLLSDPDAGQPGLLDLGLYKDSPQSALAADVSALNILLVGLQLANAQSAAALQTSIDLPPLAKVGVRAKVIEPPVIAIGPPGYDNGVPKTSAKTSQVRLALDVQALTPLGGNNDLLNLNLLLASVRISLPAGQLINLPLYVEVGAGEGILESIACYAQGNAHKVTIGARPGLAHVLLGKAPEAFTNTKKPWQQLNKEFFTLLGLQLNIKLLFGLIPVVDVGVKLNARAEVPITPPQQSFVDFFYDPQLPRAEQQLQAEVGMRQNLGASIAGIFNKRLLELDFDISELKLLGLDLGLLGSIVEALLNSVGSLLSILMPILNAVLMPVLSLLDGVLLGPLLELLGLQIGYTDVELLWADCSSGQLVQ